MRHRITTPYHLGVLMKNFDFASDDQTLVIEEELIKAPHITEKVEVLPDSETKESFIQIDTKFNNFRLINDVLRNCNRKLVDNGFISGFIETLEKRTARIYQGKKRFHAHFSFMIDFIFYRFLPKVKPFRELNKRFHIIRNRAISKCEIMGRLAFCGFEVTKMWEDNQYLHFIAQKISNPNPGRHNYGLVYSARRIGKNGKIIKVYKLRTMHPYAEFIQKYVIENNKLAKNGKVKNDFRIAKWANWMRKLFIDELPQLYSLLKGDMRLVGVRPLSLHFYSLYPEELRMERIKYRPGLIPPFYVDLPNSLDEVIDSERRFLEMKKRMPIRTDFIYFYKAMKNIIIHRARSK